MARSRQPDEAVRRLRLISEEAQGLAKDLAGRNRQAAREEIEMIARELFTAATGLDPVAQPVAVFDPSSPSTVGRFVGVALVAQERVPLRSVAPFYGSGVYALYYRGDFAPYGRLSKSETPIYVGKADPETTSAKSAQEQGARLHRRLQDHAKSIGKATTTLAIDDFECRFLVVQSGWQDAAEKYLIDLFKPIWNSEINVCYGIGKHGDAATTRANLRSPWDTLHPGRAWAAGSIADAKPPARILDEIAAHLAANPPLQGESDVLAKFFSDLRQQRS